MGLGSIVVDSWKNLITGLGDSSLDRAMGHRLYTSQPTTLPELEALYHDDPIAWKIAQKLPRDALRQGFDIETTSEADPDIIAQQRTMIESELYRFGFYSALQEAAVWSRVYGLGAIYLVSPDSGEASLPLPPGASVSALVVLEPQSHNLRPTAFYRDGVNIGKPEYYQACRVGGTAIMNIHESRMLIIRGEQTSLQMREKNNYIDYPILHWALDAIRSYDSAVKSMGNMITDASHAVFKIKGFYEAVSGNLREAIQTRLQIMDLSKFVGRSLPIDADGEDYTYQNRTMTGISDMLVPLEYQVSMAADMPATVLFGRSPAGMNATGDSDTRMWYDSIQSARTDKYAPVIDRLLFLIASYLGIDSPLEWYCSWPSLWQMTPTEEATYRQQIAQTDATYISQGVITPDEVAQARYGEPGTYSDRPPVIDVDQRAQVSGIGAMEALLKERLGQSEEKDADVAEQTTEEDVA